jgi:hypothetical protein
MNIIGRTPPSLGMRGAPFADIINIEEAGFFLEHSDRKVGKKILSMRCSQNGVYGYGEKVNILLAICGDNVGRMRWHKQWMDTECNIMVSTTAWY